MVNAFVHGFVLALALILPLGPQNTFVLSCGASAPRFGDTVPVVVTAALSDTLLIVSAVAGVSLAVLALPWLRTGLSLLGVLFLTYMGFSSWRRTPRLDQDSVGSPQGLSRRQQIGYSLSVSLLNPHAILDTVGVIGTGALLYTSAPDKWAYAGAAVLVSWLWFPALALAGRSLQRIGPSGRIDRYINRGSAIIMWLVALGYVWALATGHARVVAPP